MSNVSMIDGHIDEPRMTDKKAISLLSQMFLPCFDDEEKSALTFAINAIQDNTLKQTEIEETEHNIELLHRLKEGLKDELNTIRKENEGLLYKIKSCNSEIKRLKSIIVDTNKIGAEAITKFADGVKRQCALTLGGDEYWEMLREIDNLKKEIDNLKKEMVGD